MPQLQIGHLLVGTIIAAFVGVTSILVTPIISTPIADMRMEPSTGTVPIGDSITINLMVEANTPVNAFGGEILFDSNIMVVDSIDYNTSVADLWAVEPWYSNGDGTITFAGGTTQQGGFSGRDQLLSVTFKSIGTGEGILHLNGARILQYDGLGSDAQLGKPLDAVFTVEPEELERRTVIRKNETKGELTVVETAPSTDLNGDGKQTIADMSIFLLHFGSQNLRSDFDLDGKVTTKDMSILLGK